MPEKKTALIRTEKLGKTYEVDGVLNRALHDASLTIREGEFVAVIGPSGSGKSTLLQMLGCLDRPTEGKYYLEGKELSAYDDDALARVRNETIGFVFQAFNLLPRMSVLDNVALPLLYSNITSADRVRRAREMVALVGLTDRALYPAAKLSGGQKQRVAIARALINNPRVIFADEPTGNLDSKSGKIVLDFIKKLHKEGHTIVIVTHESYVASYADRTIVIQDGEITSDEVTRNAKTLNKILR